MQHVAQPPQSRLTCVLGWLEKLNFFFILGDSVENMGLAQIFNVLKFYLSEIISSPAPALFKIWIFSKKLLIFTIYRYACFSRYNFHIHTCYFSMQLFGLHSRDGPILSVSVSVLVSAVSAFFRLSVLVSVSIENWVPALIQSKNIRYLPIILVVQISVSEGQGPGREWKGQGWTEAARGGEERGQGGKGRGQGGKEGARDGREGKKGARKAR